MFGEMLFGFGGLARGEGGIGREKAGVTEGFAGSVEVGEGFLKSGLFRGHGDVIHYEETIAHYLPKVNNKNSQLPKWFIQNQIKLLS
jgi:hypothetical protein